MRLFAIMDSTMTTFVKMTTPVQINAIFKVSANGRDPFMKQQLHTALSPFYGFN